MDHLIGLEVELPAETQEAINVSWTTAVIVAAVVAPNRGVAVHLLGPEGVVTPAVGIEFVRFPATAEKYLRTKS
jgi:hypothetical protein